MINEKINSKIENFKNLMLNDSEFVDSIYSIYLNLIEQIKTEKLVNSKFSLNNDYIQKLEDNKYKKALRLFLFKDIINIINDSILNIDNKFTQRLEIKKKYDSLHGDGVDYILDTIDSNEEITDQDLAEECFNQIKELSKDLSFIKLKSDNPFGSINDFFTDGSKVSSFIDDLWDMYGVYYEESKPLGVYNYNGKIAEVIWFDNKDNKPDLSVNYYNIKDAEKKLDYIFKDNADSSLDLLSNQNYCFYNIVKALASGDKGIIPELDQYLISKNRDSLKGQEDFKEFCKTYFYTLLTKLFLGSGINPPLSSEENTKKITKILNNFYNFYIVEDAKKGFYKVAIGNHTINWFDENKTLGENIAKAIGKTFQAPAARHGNGNLCRAYSLKFATEKGKELELKTPMWAYKIADSIKRNGGISWKKIPIGKNIVNDKRVSIDLSDNSGWMINLIAGSGSGKGVTTMAIVGQAVAQGWPVMYLDCKPDMAKSICAWGGVGIDGNEIVETNPILTQQDLHDMVQKLKDYSISSISQTDAEAICRAIIWTRGLEIFLHLQHIRAQFKGQDKLKEDEKQIYDLIANKNAYKPILVLDEYQAESFLIEGMVGATASKELKFDDNTGETRTVNQLSSALIDIINNQCEDDSRARKYLLSIPKWIKGVYGKKEAGLCGQVNTAFGRQAGCAIFTISQRIPIIGKDRYGQTLEDTLMFYLGKYITIYGKDSDEGSSMYSANRIFKDVKDKIKLDRGLFNIIGPGCKEGAQIKTYLTIDNIDTPDGKANLCKSFGGDNEVASEILEGITNEDNEKTYINKSIKERRVDTLEYVAESNGLTVEEVKNRFAFSREYFDKVCQFIYRKSLVQRLTDVSPDSFRNYLGCTERAITDNAKIKNWQDLDKWAKIIYLSSHVSQLNQLKEIEQKQVEKENKKNEE